MLLSLLLTPLLGVFSIFINKDNELSLYNIKLLALTISILNFFISLIIFILFDFSTNQFQFVQEYHEISYYDFYLGVDGLSIYFILLTTLIIPISLVSNWKSITKDIDSYIIIILLLESLLLVVFLVLDILLFYIFFESILPPLFILIGIFGSDNRVKASFYLFLYTLLGSLFLLLSILAMSSIMSTTDFDTLFKGNFIYLTQLFLFYGIFIAFAVKTPTIFLNTWLLKAHVESPLGGSIILAAIVLKLSLYGILRLILPILPKAYMEYTFIIFLIGVITILYASLSTVRTIDVKELIAYSSVSHAAVYLLGVFSNTIQGIEGAINLGLAHGLVSPGLFICAGGVLYDRASTRIISFYRGVTQVMPLFSILFFLLCLANCGAPLSLNFIGEFLSLYGVFERSSLFGVFASSSIIFSAAYTIYMYQRIAFGGVYSRMFMFNIPDLTKREFTVLLILVVPTVLFGIYPSAILDAIHYSVSTLIYSLDSSVISCDAPIAWKHYLQNYVSLQTVSLELYHLVIILFILSFTQIGYPKSNNPSGPKPHGFTELSLQSFMPSIPKMVDLTHTVSHLGQQAINYQQLIDRHANGQTLSVQEYRILFRHIDNMENMGRTALNNPNFPPEQLASIREGMDTAAFYRSSLLTSVRKVYPNFNPNDRPSYLLPIAGSSFVTKYISVSRFVLPYISVLLSLLSLVIVFCCIFPDLELDLCIPDFIYYLLKYIEEQLKYEIILVVFVFIWSFYSYSRKIIRYLDYCNRIISYINTTGHSYLLAYLAIILLVTWFIHFGVTTISCDAPRGWELYFNSDASYHNCLGLLFWILVITIAIHHKIYLRNSCYKWGRFILYFILANISLSVLIMIFYIIYALYALFFTIEYVISNELWISYPEKHCCTVAGMDSHLTPENSPSVHWKDHVFLASRGDPNSNPTGGQVPYQGITSGQSSHPTEGQLSNQPNINEQGWRSTGGPVRWYDRDGWLQIAYWVNGEGRLSLFQPGAVPLPNVPTPEKEWVPMPGQGENPVYFTKDVEHGQKLDGKNTYNTSDGYVNYCESKKTDHKWNTVDVYNLKRKTGFCYDCKTNIDFSHYSCDNCYRHICQGCNSKYDLHAARSFSHRMNEWNRYR